MAEAHWSDITTYQNKKVNQGTLQLFTALNKMLATPEFGSEKGDFTLVQGGYNKGGVAASAGTHDGGGAGDLTPFNRFNRIRAARMLGFALWHRPRIVHLWEEHLHGIVCGDGTASAGAKHQVQEYYAGQDGLAGSGRDQDWRPQVLPILFVFNADLRDRECKTLCAVHNEPNDKSQVLEYVQLGQRFTPVAVVNVQGKRWFVTANGRCGLESNFKIAGADPTPAPVPPPSESVDLAANWWVTLDGKQGLAGPDGQVRYTRQAGYVLQTTKQVTRDGKVWYVTRYGTWYSPEHLTRQGTVSPDHNTYEVTADPFLWALAVPGIGNEKVGKADKGSRINAVAFTRLADGTEWVQAISGAWYSRKYLSVATNPIPDITATQRVLILNVASMFLTKPKYTSRLADLGRIRTQARASIVLTCESGNYAMGKQANLAFGFNGIRYDPENPDPDASFVLHGGNIKISTAVHWDSDKYRLVAEGQFEDLVPTSTHRWATWVLLRQIATGRLGFYLVTHLQYLPKGPNTIRKYDKEREDTLNEALDRAEARIAGLRAELDLGDVEIAILAGGDMNGDRNDDYDGPGRAFKAHGLTDAETIAQRRINGDKSTLNDGGSFRSGGRIDRLGVSAGVKVLEQETIYGWPGTDHNGLVTSVRI